MLRIVVTMTDYLKCPRCKCNFINDDEHIKIDFGYNRFNERFSSCAKCREKSRTYQKQARPDRARKLANEQEVINSNGTLQYCKVCDNVLSIDKFPLFDQPDLRDRCNVLQCGRWLKWKCNLCISDDERNMIIKWNGYHNGTIKNCSRCENDKDPSEFIYKGKPRGFCADCIDKCDWLQ